MGCNCNGGGRGRQVQVTSAGQSYNTGERDVRWVHTSPGGSTVPYNSPEEAQAAVAIEGGGVQKTDVSSGRRLD